MAGKLIPLIPKRVFSFSAIEPGETFSMILTEQIDISQFCDGFLLTRVHAASMAGGEMVLQLLPDGYTPLDPTTTFQGENLSYFCTPNLIDQFATPGSLYSYGGTYGQFLGQYAMLQLMAYRLQPKPAPLTATLSIDLLLRTPDDVDGEVYQAVQKAGGCGCNEQTLSALDL